MIIYSAEEYPQMSPQWWALRCGIPTSSDAKRIITAKDAQPSASQKKYAEELITDLQNQNPKYFTAKGRPLNKHTEYGRNMEEEAVDWFAQSETCEGFDIIKVGFIMTDDKRFGCSPDLMLRSKATGQLAMGGEVKNYGILKHAKYKFKKVVPLEAKAQVHHCIAVTGLPWYWVSYSPDLDCLVVKVEADEFTAALKVQLEAFDELKRKMMKEHGVGESKREETNGQVSPEGTQAIKDWEEFLSSKPAIEALNEQLPKLAGAKDGRRESWLRIKAYATSQHWILPPGGKAFVLEEVPVNF